MKKQYTRKQIAEAIAYWKRRLDESAAPAAQVDVIYMETLLGDRLFDFADEARYAADTGRVTAGGKNWTLDAESVGRLKDALRGVGPRDKVFLCGNLHPDAYSVETAAALYGYDELDAGAQPVNDDERQYLADKAAWFERFSDHELWDNMADEAFGVKFQADPFMLKAVGPDGKGTALACRVIAIS